jgi:hypothetical protein
MINSNKCDKLNYDMKLLGSKLNNNNKNKAKWRSIGLFGVGTWNTLKGTVASGIPDGCRNWSHTHTNKDFIKQTWDRNTRRMKGYQSLSTYY